MPATQGRRYFRGEGYALRMDGLINLNKPTGITSAKAVYRLRRVTGERKSGHAGTLDPGASGVLLVVLGRATKLVERLMHLPKVYRATARLDVTSESFDADRPLVEVAVAGPPARRDVEAALARFEGTIEQIPPAVSAVKVGGKPAYLLERRGKAPTLAARRVVVHWFALHGYEWPRIDFELCCGRGTYVRSLIRDLGAVLGVGGCLTSLVRTAIGPFNIESGVALDQAEVTPLDRLVMPLETVTTKLSDEAYAPPPRPVQ